jgi:hypothetical protein
MMIKSRQILMATTPLWVLAALLTLALAACTPAAGADIPTAGESQETAPADTNPAPVDQTVNETDGADPSAGEGQGTAQEPVDEMDAALVYAQCIRANGYTQWPDPNDQGQFVMRRDQGMSFNDPQRQAAMEACQDLRPPGMGGGGFAGDPEERMEMLLELAQCMRDNGVPEWPDPSPGGGPMIIGPGVGIDPDSPTFQAAAQTCLANLQGGAMFGGNR